MAHVVPAADAGDLRRYVAALDDPALPVADFRWQSFHRATIDAAAVGAGQSISVQICYHPGWHASVGGRSVATRRDGLGFLLIDAQCPGACRVDLSYTGGAEYILCRILSYLMVAALAGYACFRGSAPLRICEKIACFG
jgi:hypothetical protein